jgi:branched-chain amino acid transport system substrate-binding protein
MELGRRSLLATGAAAAAATSLPRPSRAQAANTIRIGVLNDQSGLYRDITGPTAVACTRQAVQDFGPRDMQVEILVADHQNRPDVGVARARQWFDREGIDMIVDVPNSAVALAVSGVAREKNKVYLNTSAATADLTGPQCSPNTVHWTFDTWMLAQSTGGAMVKAGGDTWFFVTADYAFGHALERDTTNFVKAQGGRVLGSVRTPFPGTTDFSSFLLQAQASKAQILGLANAGGDTINAIKAANEFGITKTMKLAGLLMFINDVHSLGLKATQGMYLTDSWYWNHDAETRAWARKFFDKMKRMPSSIQAADYSVTQTYLKAVKAIGSDDADKVLDHMRKTKINDMYAKGGYIRPDGRMVHDMYLMQVKTPAESKEPWDYYNVVATIKGEDAFTTKAESTCALWK